MKTECGGGQVEDKSITAVGPVNFSVKIRNELAGTNATIFSGKMKVGKTLSNEHGPKAVNKFVYYVNHDWNLPIGYVWYTQDSIYAWDYPDFHIGFWVRGDAYNFDPHLFYKGQDGKSGIGSGLRFLRFCLRTSEKAETPDSKSRKSQA